MIFPTIVSFRHRGLSATAPDGSLPNAIPERGTGLNPGSHTLVIEVTGRKNTSAQSAWIWVDAFDFAP